MLNDFQDMPHTMKQLAWVQFFSWFALFAMWIYTTPAVTSHVYGTTDTTSALYNEGANWVGVGFGTYNGVAAVVAFAIPVLARRTSRRAAHAICLVCGALGLLSILMLKDPRYLLGSMVGVGIAWASILAMPYAILTGSLPPSKMGYYMGIFNFFIVIPQIVAAALLGFFVGRFFGGQAIYALVIGGASLLVAAALTLRVEDRDDMKAGTWHPGFPATEYLPRRRSCSLACGQGRPAERVAPTTAPSASADAARFWNSATIYFLLTDRFPNGDTTNDRALGRDRDGAVLRTFEGGDLAGVLQRIEEGYFDSLGCPRHLDDAVRGADPRQRERGHGQDLRLPRLLDPGLDRRRSRARHGGRSPRGGRCRAPAWDPGASWTRSSTTPGRRRHRTRRGRRPGSGPSPTAPTGATPPRSIARW